MALTLRMTMTTVNLNEFREKRKSIEDVNKLKEMLIALKDAYKYVHPYIEYPIFFRLAEELLKCRIAVRANIERIEKEQL